MMLTWLNIYCLHIVQVQSHNSITSNVDGVSAGTSSVAGGFCESGEHSAALFPPERTVQETTMQHVQGMNYSQHCCLCNSENAVQLVLTASSRAKRTGCRFIDQSSCTIGLCTRNKGQHYLATMYSVQILIPCHHPCFK